MKREDISPDDALQILKEGNQRFLQNKLINTDLPKQVKQTAEGQFPFAAILGCVDSRTASELIFNIGIGELINVRVAGNIVNEDILGSLEYACTVANTRLIVVLGHTRCGAIESACDQLELGNITSLLKKIRPAIEAETNTLSNRTGSNIPFINEVSLHNIQNSIDLMRKNSTIIRELENKGKIRILGAIYDVETGSVTFL
jgi:carbonic anhydrase